VADAQSIFAEELPALPLYYRIRLVATRPDLCGVLARDPLESALWNLEKFNDGEGCP
jgi:peptide/nickel transport system substrate-binding protein